MPLHNPFSKQPEKKELTAKLEVSARNYNDVIGKAKACLDSKQFTDYAKAYEKLAKDLFEIFLDTPSSDPITESIRVRMNAMRDLGIRVLETANLPERVIKKEDKPSV